MEELDRKIAEFAGFKEVIDSFSGKPNGYWRCPDETTLDGFCVIHGSRLRFTDPELGIAYLFKWVVPKLDYLELEYDYAISSESDSGIQHSDYVYSACIISADSDFVGRDKTAALALCYAVEKLIDSQVPSEVK